MQKFYGFKIGREKNEKLTTFTDSIEKRNLEEPEQMRHKIIYIDETLGSRTIMSQFLEHNGFEGVVTAETYDEGIEKIRAWRPDLILISTSHDPTQHEEGLEESLEVIATIRSMDEIPSIPIIVIGSWLSAKIKERFYTTGVNEYFKQPVHLGLLQKVLSGYLDRQTVSISRQSSSRNPFG